MQMVRIQTVLCVFAAGVLFLLGCASRTPVGQAEPKTDVTPQQTPPEDVATAEIIQAAEEVLTRMHFAIEKLDVQQGIIRTRPLRGGQFFELWRRDNASLADWEEANLQCIRRYVELRVEPEDKGQKTEDSGRQTEDGPVLHLPSGLRVECVASVQRLSLWANEVAGASAALQVHISSTDALERIRLSPLQQQAMTWIDLGQDSALAARVLTRVEQRLQGTD